MENKLGFGLMRLPKNKAGEIDIPRVCEMADAFLARGFTYFDTAYVYAGSEVAFREAVVRRHPRESFTVASKMAGWQLSETRTPEVMFNEQLERCGVTYFDYYLLHSLQPSRLAAYGKNDCWNFCLQKKKEGKIRHFGFSFHGAPDLLEQLLNDHPEVDFVQLQINYADWENNAIWSGENYRVCRRHNKPIVVMEPVKGGLLANLAPELQQKLDAVNPGKSAASFALRYAASLEGVMMVLSGMSDPAQMEDNLRTFEQFEPLTDDERRAIDEVTQALLSADTIPCTSCRYCVAGCPKHIAIPDVFKSYNMIQTYGEHSRPHLYYTEILAQGNGHASDCIGCRRCEAACPQHLEIVSLLKKVSAVLDR